MENSKKISKKLRYADYQVVAERSVCLKIGKCHLSDYNVQTILAHDLKWFTCTLCC
jgi:hypothetical protein